MLVRLTFLFVCLSFVFFVFFHVSLGQFVLVLLAFVVLSLVSSVLSQEFGKNVSEITYFVSTGT